MEKNCSRLKRILLSFTGMALVFFMVFHLPASTAFALTEDENSTETATITYRLSGGTYDGSSEDIVEEYAAGIEITVHEAPEKEGCNFRYWEGSQYSPGDKYTVTDDHVFTAVWEKDSTDVVDPDKPAGDTDKDSGDTQSGSVKTGDDNQIGFWKAAAASIIAAMITIRRLKNSG